MKKETKYFLLVETTCKSLNLNNFIPYFVDTGFASSHFGKYGMSYKLDLDRKNKKHLERVIKQVINFFSNANEQIKNKWNEKEVWYRPSCLYDNIKILGFTLVKETTVTTTKIEEKRLTGFDY